MTEQPRAPRRVRPSAARRAVGSAAAAALLAAGCSSPTEPTSATAADLVHVHALAEDSDADLFVATHTGLFELDVDGGGVARVGDASHDLMGFTAVGPGDLLASGHPDLRDTTLQKEGKPPLLGLVGSDNGRDWRPLSLLGEVDFHSLEAAHGKVYGADATSGRFMVSDDRTVWETRATRPGLVDFAVSPDDPDMVVASDDGGVSRSDDGGRTWQQASALPYAYLEWTPEGLLGAAPDGTVAQSQDGGRSWREVGSLGGQPEAFLVTPDSVYAAVVGRGIVRSADGGATFEVLLTAAART